MSAVPIAAVTYWSDDMGAAWIALRDAAAAWPGRGDFEPYARVAMRRAVQRARWADAGLRHTRDGWRQTETPFTDLGGGLGSAMVLAV